MHARLVSGHQCLQEKYTIWGTPCCIKWEERAPVLFSQQLFESSALRKSTHLPDMFSRLATLVPIAALVAVATAAPGAVEARDSVSQCNTSDQYCCNQAITVGHFFIFHYSRVIYECIHSQQTTSAVSGLLGVLNGLNLGAGLTCSPISIIGIPGNSCTQQPVCCTGNTFVSCVPSDGTDGVLTFFLPLAPYRTVWSMLPALPSTSTCEVDIGSSCVLALLFFNIALLPLPLGEWNSCLI